MNRRQMIWNLTGVPVLLVGTWVACGLLGLLSLLLPTNASAAVAGNYIGCGTTAPSNEILIPNPIDFPGGGTYFGDSGYFSNQPTTGWELTGSLYDFVKVSEVPLNPDDALPVTVFEYSGVIELYAQKEIYITGVFATLATRHAIYDFTIRVHWRERVGGTWPDVRYTDLKLREGTACAYGNCVAWVPNPVRLNVCQTQEGPFVLSVYVEQKVGFSALFQGRYDLPLDNSEVIVPVAVTGTFETVQAVVNTKTTDLVATKSTVVRGYLRTPPGTPPMQATATLCIDKNDSGFCEGGLSSTSASGTLFAEDYIFSVDELRDAVNSLNFYVTDDFAIHMTSGTHTFDVEVEPVTKGQFNPTFFNFERDFRTSQDLEILAVPVAITDANGIAVFPSIELLRTAHELTRVVYPISDDGITLNDDVGFEVVSSPEGLWDSIWGPEYGKDYDRILLALSRRLSESQLRRGVSKRIVVGVVPESVLDAEGGQSTALGLSFPDGGDIVGLKSNDVAGVVLTTASATGFGATVAHELGHVLNLGDEYSSCEAGFPDCPPNPEDAPNSPPQSRSEGDDVGRFIASSAGAFDVTQFVPNRKAIFGSPEGDIYGFMGSGDTANSWVGNLEYEYLFDLLTDSQSAPLNQAAAAEVSREVIYLAGVMGKDGSLSLEPVLALSSDARLETPTGSGYSVQFRDGGGSLLGSTEFGLSFEREIFLKGGGAEVKVSDTTPFGMTTELPAETASVSVWEDSTMLAEMLRSSNVPTVEITSVQILEVDSLELTWSGSDADGDELNYSVLYSRDGNSIELIASGIAETSSTFDLFDAQGVGPSGAAFFRVVVSDGLDSSETKELLTLSLLNQWKRFYFDEDELLDAAVSGDLADPDGDTYPNLMEYAMGFNPEEADPKGAIVLAKESDNLCLDFRKSKTAFGMIISVEASSDLIEWAEVEGIESVVKEEDSAWLMKIQTPVGEERNRFLRLHFEIDQ